jgi:hypothetical protein
MRRRSNSAPAIFEMKSPNVADPFILARQLIHVVERRVAHC